MTSTVWRTDLAQTNGSDFHYQLSMHPLKCVDCQHELGVIMDKVLKPRRQYTKAAKNAYLITRTTKAAFANITTALFQAMHGMFIRHHLVYSFKAWRPWLKKCMKLLEKAQPHSTKLVKCLRCIEHETRLQVLSVESSSCRMDRGNMLLVYNIPKQDDLPDGLYR